MEYGEEFEVLFDRELLKETVQRLGREITEDYKDKNLLLVSVLKGAVVFLCDLMREIKCDCVIDFMSVSTYEGTKSTGVVKFKKDLDINPEGMDILIVEDILESGITLEYLTNVLKGKNAKSIKICTLIDKPLHRKGKVNADYVGLTIKDDPFILGYGLDYDEKYRNLPFIGVLKPND